MSETIYSPHIQPLLDELQYQGQRNDCAPFTIATVVNAFFQAGLSGEQLGQAMNRVRWRGIIPVVRRIPDWATFPWGMVDVFKDYGLEARWRFFASVDYLKTRLLDGYILMPIIVSWRPTWAHVMTLVAWDEQRGWGFANTQTRHSDIYWLEHDHFCQRWRNGAHLLVEIKPSTALQA